MVWLYYTPKDKQKINRNIHLAFTLVGYPLAIAREHGAPQQNKQQTFKHKTEDTYHDEPQEHDRFHPGRDCTYYTLTEGGANYGIGLALAATLNSLKNRSTSSPVRIDEDTMDAYLAVSEGFDSMGLGLAAML